MCPKCKSKKIRVYDSRKSTINQFVWRRRNCEKCSHVWTTIEITKEHYDELTRQANLSDTLKTLEDTATDIIGKVKGILSEDRIAGHVHADLDDNNRDYL